MNIKPLYQEILPSRIDLDDLAFCLAPVGREKISAQLRDSVARCGLIPPPLLTSRDDGKFTVVAGHARLRAFQLIPGAKLGGCLVLPATTPPAILLTLALQDILLRRPATLLEKAICWQKAVDCMGKERAAREFGPQLELTRQLTPARLEKIATLDPKMQEALQAGRLEPKTLFKLMDLDRPDGDILFATIEHLRPSSSNQRKLIEHCLELHHRRKQRIAALLAEPECLAIINHPEANPPQKTAMLMSWLTGQCFPRLTEAEKEFRSFVGKLQLPKWATIEHTPSFEQDSLKLTIDFTDQARLAEKWPTIRQAVVADRES
jgi:ParB-like chromosome segregation protein Spo0J